MFFSARQQPVIASLSDLLLSDAATKRFEGQTYFLLSGNLSAALSRYAELYLRQMLWMTVSEVAHFFGLYLLTSFMTIAKTTHIHSEKGCRNFFYVPKTGLSFSHVKIVVIPTCCYDPSRACSFLLPGGCGLLSPVLGSAPFGG